MKAKNGRKRLVKDVLVRAILAGRSTTQALAAVRRAFPKAKTTPACVAYYRTKLRAEGVKVPAAKRKARAS